MRDLGAALPRIPLRRVDLTVETEGLPPSLIEAIEADGGLWSAGDAYTSADEVVETARQVGAVALRLDFGDLALLERLPGIRYLHVRSDGRPPLDPIAALIGLRALILEPSALRGDLDPLAFADLRWLRIGLGGKGGAAVLPAIQRGHPNLEWLSVDEGKARAATDVCAGFPSLRVLHVGHGDLRELGDLAAAVPKLEKVALDFTQVRTLDGLAGLQGLETLDLRGGRVRDLTPLRSLRRLRYARLELTDLESLEPLRDHPSLRMVAFAMAQELDLSVLASIAGLKAVRRGKRFERPAPWPKLAELSTDDPLRVEWSRAMAE
jgi:hypothetical protein